MKKTLLVRRTLLALILLSCFAGTAQAYQAGDTVAAEIAGKMQLQKRVTIVDFFAQWCVSCRIEIPLLAKAYNQLDKNLIEVLGVDVDDTLEKAQRFQADMRAKGMNFRVINDLDQTIISAFKPKGMPALYYIVDGKVVGSRMGAIHHIDHQIMADLKSLGVVK